jgi:hypothetical protein
VVAAIKANEKETNMLMDFAVCSVENRECMLGTCPKCPGVNPVHDEILKIIGDKEFVVYWRWQTVDRAEMKVFEK